MISDSNDCSTAVPHLPPAEGKSTGVEARDSLSDGEVNIAALKPIQGALLGKGAYSEVKLMVDESTGKKYAVKCLEKQRMRSKEELAVVEREIAIHRTLIHPNVIGLRGVQRDEQTIRLVLEFAPHGSLFGLIRKRKCLGEPEAAYYFWQVLRGIRFLHERGIIHRDIKPENILLDEGDVPKISDFGWSVEGGARKTFCGTLEYMAPEVLQRGNYDEKVDVWALGILLYEMLHGRAPFQVPSRAISTFRQDA